MHWTPDILLKLLTIIKLFPSGRIQQDIVPENSPRASGLILFEGKVSVIFVGQLSPLPEVTGQIYSTAFKRKDLKEQVKCQLDLTQLELTQSWN